MCRIEFFGRSVVHLSKRSEADRELAVNNRLAVDYFSLAQLLQVFFFKEASGGKWKDQNHVRQAAGVVSVAQ